MLRVSCRWRKECLVWLVIRNRQHHKYLTATEEERKSMYQPGDIIAIGDWPDGPGKKVEEKSTMIAIEIKDRTTAEFEAWMKQSLIERFGPQAESKFDEFFFGAGKEKRGWKIDIPTVLQGLTAGQKTWLQNNKNNISLTGAQFANAFKTAIKRRPGSSAI